MASEGIEVFDGKVRGRVSSLCPVMLSGGVEVRGVEHGGLGVSCAVCVLCASC